MGAQCGVPRQEHRSIALTQQSRPFRDPVRPSRRRSAQFGGTARVLNLDWPGLSSSTRARARLPQRTTLSLLPLGRTGESGGQSTGAERRSRDVHTVGLHRLGGMVLAARGVSSSQTRRHHPERFHGGEALQRTFVGRRTCDNPLTGVALGNRVGRPSPPATFRRLPRNPSNPIQATESAPRFDWTFVHSVPQLED